MLLNALSNYLQHQGAPKTQEAVQTAAVAGAPAVDSSASGDDAYVLSSRALMVSAVAHEFDVTHLEPAQISPLQQRLQHFGLLNGRALDAYRLLHAQQEAGPIDAVAVYQQAAQPSDIPMHYAHKQGVQQMFTLMSNLASARLS